MTSCLRRPLVLTVGIRIVDAQVYPPESMMVVPSESLKAPDSFKKVMEHFAALINLPRGGRQVRTHPRHPLQRACTYRDDCPPEGHEVCGTDCHRQWSSSELYMRLDMG